MTKNPTAPLYLTRFIAAYLVLVLHYIPLSVMNTYPLMHLFGEAVDYFFFISGFVMIVSSKHCLNFVNKTIDLDKKDYWRRRVARIYPMYILALFLVVLFHYTVREIDPSVPTKIWLETIGVSRWFFAASINFPDWSVSCEFLFYLLFPFALVWVVKKSWPKLTTIVLGLFFLNVICMIVYFKMMPRLLSLNDSFLYNSLVKTVYQHPIFKFTIFLFGCLCGRFYLSSPWMVTVRKYSVIILIASLIGIVIACQLIGLQNRQVIDSGILSLLYFPLVLSICSLKGPLLKALSWKPFIFLGEISYGIYIMQVPVGYYFKHFFFDEKDFTSVGEFFLYTLALIAVCSVLYYVYEVPAKKMIAGRKLKVKVPVNAV
jgi:peptidoglycan/LPS O-acetylase OafA/YrhL